MLSDLLSLLSWAPDAQLLANHLLDLKQAAMKYRLDRLLSKYPDSALATWLALAEQDAVTQLLESPLVFRVLHEPRFRSDEVRLMQLHRFLSPDVIVENPALPTDAWGLEPGVSRQQASEDSILIDFDSAWAGLTESDSGMLVDTHTPLRLDTEARAALRQKLNRAFAIIRNCTFTWQMIRQFTRIIRIRIDDSPRQGSEQMPFEIGTIRLHNIHSPQYSELLMAEAIVHETIHSILFVFERHIEPLARAHEPDVHASTQSPWSGNFISHAAMTHAICVYYGIWSFLRKIRDQYPDKAELATRLLHNSFGFRRGVDINSYIDFMGFPNQKASGMFRAMQRIVLKATQEV